MSLSLCGLLSCINIVCALRSLQATEAILPVNPTEIRQGHLRVYEKGQRGAQAEDQLPEQTASHPRLSMRMGPGHSFERHPGFPGIGPILQDRGTAGIMGGNWFEIPTTLLGAS